MPMWLDGKVQLTMDKDCLPAYLQALPKLRDSNIETSNALVLTNNV